VPGGPSARAGKRAAGRLAGRDGVSAHGPHGRPGDVARATMQAAQRVRMRITPAFPRVRRQERMNRHPFGSNGLEVSILGFGAMHLNDDRVTEADAGYLLNAVLDLGVNLIDTARGYGLSEERIGRHLAHRRRDFVLSTKVGYGIPGVEDWTYDCIIAGVEAALGRMRCECIDIVHLHSCPRNILEQGDVIRALDSCRKAGKLRIAAYSGDNLELDFAIQSRRFRSVQTSISVCDQANLAQRLPALEIGGLGVIAKRPLAGAVWNNPQRPRDHAEGIYWDRWHAMGLADHLGGMSGVEMALRFVTHWPGISSSIVGTNNLAHFEENVKLVGKGPLADEQIALIRAAFQRHGRDWCGVI
jgi:aryl-alcohol dehydrogenase-like predicted oxidoreductase